MWFWRIDAIDVNGEHNGARCAPYTPIEIQYIFELPEGRKETFSLQLDPTRLQLLVDPNQYLPAWSKLAYHQCPNIFPEIIPRQFVIPNEKTKHCYQAFRFNW